MASSAFKASAQMALAGGSRLLHGARGMAARGAKWVARKVGKFIGKGCRGCFTAATLVWTAQGMVPIAEIQEGQSVYAALEEGQASDYSENEVGTTIYIGEASLVKLTVRHQDGSVEVINTTDEHPFHPVHTGEWTRADQLQIGDLLSAMHGTAELVAVEYGTERVPVYNLSIPGSPTYYVGTHGLWVHNCWAGKHHLIPKYMGGLQEWATTPLTHADHVLIHRLIDSASSARGIPTRSQGAQKVNEWLLKDPEVNVHKLREALVEAYGAFDIQKGTSLLTNMMDEMRKHGF